MTLRDVLPLGLLLTVFLAALVAAAPPVAAGPVPRPAVAASVPAPEPAPAAGDLVEARETVADPRARMSSRIAAAKLLVDTGKRKNIDKVVDAFIDVESSHAFLNAVLPVLRPVIYDRRGKLDPDLEKKVRRQAASKKIEWKVHGLLLGLALGLDGMDGDAFLLLEESAKDVLRNDQREPEDRQNMRDELWALDVACEVLEQAKPPDPRFLWQLQLLRKSPVYKTRLVAYDSYIGLGVGTYADVVAEAAVDESLAIQDLAYEALIEARRPEVVPALISLLGDRPNSSVDTRVLPRLFRATGQRYMSKSQWQKWLDRTDEVIVLTEEEFEVAQQALADAMASSRYGPQGSFFNRPVKPGHVVFVIDTSGSMSAGVTQGGAPQKGVGIFLPKKERPRTTRLALVKGQVVNALEGLTDQEFDIVAFGTHVRRWREDGSRSFESREEALAAAKAYVNTLRRGGGTNIHGGLKEAFAIDGVTEVFLLSDGTPTEGIEDHGKIVRDVKRWSKKAKGATLHCIAMGMTNPLLERLGDATEGGTYAEVEVPASQRR